VFIDAAAQREAGRRQAARLPFPPVPERATRIRRVVLDPEQPAMTGPQLGEVSAGGGSPLGAPFAGPGAIGDSGFAHACIHRSAVRPAPGSDLEDEPRGLFVAVAQLIEARRILLGLLARGEDDAVVRRLAAYRVGIVGIAGKHEGLAAAAAEILLFFIATAAGLGHPVVATIFVETEGVLPDVLDAVLAHIGELYRQLPRAVAGQGGAVRGDVEKQVAPAVHAGLGALFVIVGRHEDQLAGVVLGG